MHSSSPLPPGASRAATLALALAMLLPWHGAHAEPAAADGERFALRIDNDFPAGTDAQYSSGLGLAYAWPATRTAVGDDQDEVRNHAFGVQQSIYTPEKNGGTRDRPYAATLTAAWTFNRRTPERLSSFSLVGGVLGPAANGEQVQNGFHQVFGSDRRQGWDQQVQARALLNANYLQLLRSRPWTLHAHSLDLIYAGGAAAGNLRDEVRAGLQLRLSRALPEDFGGAPLQDLGAALAPAFSPRPAGAAVWYAFGALARNWYDATTDRPPAHDRRQIDSMAWRWEAGGGVQFACRHWRVDAALIVAGREYRQQPGAMRYVRVVVQRPR